jgi:hypothetical protein
MEQRGTFSSLQHLLQLSYSDDPEKQQKAAIDLAVLCEGKLSNQLNILVSCFILSIVIIIIIIIIIKSKFFFLNYQIIIYDL